jgi:hypothetical protein
MGDQGEFVRTSIIGAPRTLAGQIPDELDCFRVITGLAERETPIPECQSRPKEEGTAPGPFDITSEHGPGDFQTLSTPVQTHHR